MLKGEVKIIRFCSSNGPYTLHFTLPVSYLKKRSLTNEMRLNCVVFLTTWKKVVITSGSGESSNSRRPQQKLWS